MALDANSLENSGNARRLDRVVKGGIIYERDALLKPLAGRID
jgi:hypothetical protein